jgi:hypothetical protein
MHRAAVEPREFLKECLLRRARSFVLFHTHPSGDPTPSVQDLEFTQRMVQAYRIMGHRDDRSPGSRRHRRVGVDAGAGCLVMQAPPSPHTGGC